MYVFLQAKAGKAGTRGTRGPKGGKVRFGEGRWDYPRVGTSAMHYGHKPSFFYVSWLHLFIATVQITCSLATVQITQRFLVKGHIYQSILLCCRQMKYNWEFTRNTYQGLFLARSSCFTGEITSVCKHPVETYSIYLSYQEFLQNTFLYNTILKTIKASSTKWGRQVAQHDICIHYWWCQLDLSLSCQSLVICFWPLLVSSHPKVSFTHPCKLFAFENILKFQFEGSKPEFTFGNNLVPVFIYTPWTPH